MGNRRKVPLGKPLKPIADDDKIVITEEEIEAILAAWLKYAPPGYKNLHTATDIAEEEIEI